MLILFSSTTCYAADAIFFTTEEQRYIEAHSVVKYGISPHSYPIETFNSTGEHIGLTRDYIDLIAATVGINFQPVFSSNDNDSVTNLQHGKISLLTSTSSAFAEANDLVSSVPIFSTWPVTVTRKATRHIETPDDLMEGYVTITDYLSLIEWFTKQFPGVNYKIVYSPEETISEVIRRQAEAAVVLSPTALYYMNVIYPGQLKISHPHAAKISLMMATRPEDQILIDIINKVIASVSAKQQAEIAAKWIISDNNIPLPSDNKLILYAGGLTAVLLCLLILIFYRYRRLKMEFIQLGSTNNLELSVIAHELRTPLIGILTACEGLVNKIASTSQRERIANVIHVTRELLDNLDLSLDNAKINAGSVKQHLQPHLLAELCDTTVKLFISFAETHTTTLQARYLSKQCFLPHLIDGTLLSQALNNVVSNAIKHTHAGMVLIECSLLQIDGKNMFSIEVIDTGTGIPHKMLARLSEPFYSGKFSCTDGDALGSKGTGLGLFVAKKNIHLTGGHLAIASQSGVGSRVTIALPAIPAHYAIENPLPEGLYIMLSAEIASSLYSEITQLLDGCELPYYSPSDPLPPSARGPAIHLQLDLSQNQWQLSNQEGESVVVPRPLYASALYLAITSLCNEDPSVESIYDTSEADSPNIITEPRRLLVVEDEPLLLEVQHELFSSMGFEVDAVANAQQAYHSWLQHQHTIIVTDCRLDESDGFELVRHLRKLMQGTPEPALIIGQSASLQAEDAQRAHEVGMDYLLQKPITREQWQQLIRNYFASEEKEHD